MLSKAASSWWQFSRVILIVLWGTVCRKLGVLSYLVHILASGEESGLVAAAVWALLQLAAEDPTNQKVVLGKANPAYLLE